MSSVLHIPELVAHICGYLEVQGVTRVARTSRFHFSCAIPFAWEHVEKGSALLGILPRHSVRCSPYNSYNHTFPEKAPSVRLVGVHATLFRFHLILSAESLPAIFGYHVLALQRICSTCSDTRLELY